MNISSGTNQQLRRDTTSKHNKSAAEAALVFDFGSDFLNSNRYAPSTAIQAYRVHRKKLLRPRDTISPLDH
jgi:hypothetical protein